MGENIMSHAASPRIEEKAERIAVGTDVA